MLLERNTILTPELKRGWEFHISVTSVSIVESLLEYVLKF